MNQGNVLNHILQIGCVLFQHHLRIYIILCLNLEVIGMLRWGICWMHAEEEHQEVIHVSHQASCHPFV